MFTWLRSLVSSSCVLELSSERIRVRDLGTGQVHDFAPLLSIDASNCVVSIGRPIASAAVKTFEPFTSRAAFAKDGQIAELLMQYAYSKVGAHRWIRPAPLVAMLVPSERADPVGSMEDSALIDLSSKAGARLTVIHRGERLTDAAALALMGKG